MPGAGQGLFGQFGPDGRIKVVEKHLQEGHRPLERRAAAAGLQDNRPQPGGADGDGAPTGRGSAWSREASARAGGIPMLAETVLAAGRESLPQGSTSRFEPRSGDIPVAAAWLGLRRQECRRSKGRFMGRLAVPGRTHRARTEEKCGAIRAEVQRPMPVEMETETRGLMEELECGRVEPLAGCLLNGFEGKWRRRRRRLGGIARCGQSRAVAARRDTRLTVLFCAAPTLGRHLAVLLLFHRVPLHFTDVSRRTPNKGARASRVPRLTQFYRTNIFSNLLWNISFRSR